MLLVGAADFTLLGRPLVRSDLVDVEATVVEKTLSHTKTHFRKKRRKQYMRINCECDIVVGLRVLLGSGLLQIWTNEIYEEKKTVKPSNTSQITRASNDN